MGNKKNEEDDKVVEIDNGVDTESPLKSELDKAKTDLLYLAAEFENYKKHAIRERSEALKYGSERFIRELLEVIDNLDRALTMEVTPETLPTFREGVAMTHRELGTLLNRHGVQEVNPVGQPFDPATQEALTSEESDEVPPGSVSRVFKKAYKFHDRLLRPAQVVVAKAPEKKD